MARPKADAKASKKESAPAKAGKKNGKAGKVDEVAAAAPVSADELEEQEEAAEEAAAGGGGGNAAALAAASGGGEMSASFKNFRHHPDMENFYRFIFDNDLRHEALAIIDEIQTQKALRKQQGKSAGKSAH